MNESQIRSQDLLLAYQLGAITYREFVDVCELHQLRNPLEVSDGSIRGQLDDGPRSNLLSQRIDWKRGQRAG